ncbi:MAG: alpha/beta fold hydrolase, partial [Gemmatimonadota bacterium]
ALVDSEDELIQYVGGDAERVERFEPTWSQAFFGWLTTPAVRGFLFFLVVIGLYMEMQSPGLGAGTAIALSAGAIMLGAPYMTGLASMMDLLLILVGLALLAVLFWPLARHRLIYPGGRLAPEMADPALHGLPRSEQVWLTAEDGVRVHGWWTPADPSDGGGPSAAAGPSDESDLSTGARAPDGGRGAVIYCHGNAESMATRAWIAARLAAMGFDVLLFDYRGYGLSEGRASEEGLARDARAAWRHVVEERGIAPDQVVLMGHSLGSAVATRLALELAGDGAAHAPGDGAAHASVGTTAHRSGSGATRPETGRPVARPAALVVGAPFPDMPALFAHHAPWLPERALRWRRDRHAAGSRLVEVGIPTLVVIGRHDEVIPPALSRQVAEGLDDAVLVTVPADHAAVMGHPEVWDRMRRFLQAVPGP